MHKPLPAKLLLRNRLSDNLNHRGKTPADFVKLIPGGIVFGQQLAPKRGLDRCSSQRCSGNRDGIRTDFLGHDNQLSSVCGNLTIAAGGVAANRAPALERSAAA